MSLWHYVSKLRERWLSWAVRGAIGADKKVVKAIKAHLWGILNAIILNVSNGSVEELNSLIKMIKMHSRGFRNKERFSNAIYFHLGGLNLYPERVI